MHANSTVSNEMENVRQVVLAARDFGISGFEFMQSAVHSAGELDHYVLRSRQLADLLDTLDPVFLATLPEELLKSIRGIATTTEACLEAIRHGAQWDLPLYCVEFNTFAAQGYEELRKLKESERKKERWSWASTEVAPDSSAPGTKRAQSVDDIIHELGTLQESPEADHEKSTGARADVSADGKKRKQILPRNEEALRLAHKLIRELPDGDKSRNEIALDFTDGNESKAQTLLRKIRDFSALMKLINQADPRRK